MVISRGGEIATPRKSELTLGFRTIGMEQQTPVTTSHHAETEAYETDRAVTEIMTLPAALGHAVGAEQGGGDLAVGRAVELSVERAQGQDKLISTRLRERSGIWAGVAAGHAAPKADRRPRADFEELVEGEKRGGRFGASLQMYAMRTAAIVEESPCTVGAE